VTYRVQDRAGGIAEALSLCEDFALHAGGGQVCVLLGDNMFEDSLMPYRREWEGSGYGAMNILKEVPDPERFGVAEIEDDRIIGIEEKPKKPKSNWAVTGIYFYNGYAFKVANDLEPSQRGELEITDVNNAYIRRGDMACGYFRGWWSDAGTHESYAIANELMRKK
jgi:glucose-1-phosphate thymidylyltransferase